MKTIVSKKFLSDEDKRLSPPRSQKSKPGGVSFDTDDLLLEVGTGKDEVRSLKLELEPT